MGSGSIRGYPYWISSENSLELIELSSINKVSLFRSPFVISRTDAQNSNGSTSEA
jgi:hypothetical protein